jgi:VanZ family protein
VRKRLFFWIALCWAIIIAFFCLTSSNNIPTVTIPYVDKFVHAFFYFVFTSVLFLFLKKRMNSSDIIRPLVVSLLVSVFYGLVIELMQELFTMNRKAEVTDVVGNVSGALLAFFIIYYYDKKKV